MQAQTAKRLLTLQNWSKEIKACRQSGLSVREWCAANNVNIKTYYNHEKRVREEMLEMMEPPMPLTSETTITCNPCAATFAALPSMHQALKEAHPLAKPMHKHIPVQITVIIGSHKVEINNGADMTLTEQVLKAVSRI